MKHQQRSKQHEGGFPPVAAWILGELVCLVNY